MRERGSTTTQNDENKSKQSRIIKLLHYNEQTNNDPNLPFKYYTKPTSR